MSITSNDGTDPGPGNGSNFDTGLPSSDQSGAIHRINLLEQELFDGEGHPRRGMNVECAAELIAEINALRFQLGWLSLDLEHHPIWPDDLSR
jgi:hypothetical protein